MTRPMDQDGNEFVMRPEHTHLNGSTQPTYEAPLSGARGRRVRRAARISVAGLLCSTLVAGMAGQAFGLTSTAAEDGYRTDAPPVPPTKPTKVTPVRPRKVESIRLLDASDPAAAWPKSGRASVDLSGVAPGQTRRAGGLPVQIGPAKRGPGQAGAGRVSVDLLDRETADKVGVSGPVMQVASPAGGPVRLRLDVTEFAEAMGGAWASRLQLVAYPACVLERPEDPECNQPTPLETTRAGKGGVLVADVALPEPAVPASPAPDGTAPPEAGDTAGPDQPPTNEAPTDEAPTDEAPAGGEEESSGPDGVEEPDAAESVEPSVARLRATGGVSLASYLSSRPASAAQTTFGSSTVAPTEGSMVVAASSTASGPKGDWAATGLKSAASWSAGGSNGGFTWSYGFRLPQVASGLAPNLGLGYDSSSVDGQTSAENNQPSWVGVGWSLGPGFIERSYTSCGMDADKAGANNSGHKTGDLCWDGEPLSMSFGEHAGEVVPAHTPADGSAPTQFRLRNDDETRIERVGARGSAGEQFKVTTGDGTQYFFGQERATTGAPATNAAWKVPVFGNHAGEPGYTAGDFAASHTHVVWRWNLSYVVSPAEDSVTYYWAKETNRYGRNRDTGVSVYDRGGWLSRVEYGTRAGSEDTATAPAKVTFAVEERCRPSAAACEPGDLTQATASDWPDVPFDQICTSSTSCGPERSAPSFFTRKRLAEVTTQVATGAGAWRQADKWQLTHTFPDPGDGDTVLWLDTLTQVGMGAKTAFGGAAMDNRVDGIDNATALMRHRLTRIDDEFGQRVSVSYTDPDATTAKHYAQHCRPGDIPANPASNSRLCFPAEYVPPGSYEPDADPHWFHKYLATAVSQTDTTDAAAQDLLTSYHYNGAPAWAKNDNPQVPAAKRTWDQWRGYTTVETRQGAPGQTTQSSAIATYYRGMNGDPDGNGGNKTVTVTDSTGTAVSDHRWLAGRPRETRIFNRPGGQLLSSVISDYDSELTTPMTGPRAPRRVNITGTHQRSPAAGGATHRVDVVATYDDHGRQTSNDNRAYTVASDGGETQTDRLCTTTSYATNTAAWMLTYPKQTRTVSVACTVAHPANAKTVTATRYAYDDQAIGAAPSQGRVTRAEVLDRHDSAGAEVYVSAQRTSYDTWGRATEVLDAKNRATTIGYQQTVPGAVANQTTTTSPDPDGTGPLAPHVTTMKVDDRWGVPTRVEDPAGGITQATYDPLGRLSKVWKPGRATTEIPDAAYSYHVAGTTADAFNGVTTKSLVGNDDTLTSVELFDGLLRPRQTQRETWQTLNSGVREQGRTLVNTSYDTAGRQISVEARAYNANPPTAQMVNPATEHEKTTLEHDGAGRVVMQEVTWTGEKSAKTTTRYDGNITHVTPPTGGIVTSTVTDPRGRTVELWQHPDGTPDTTGHQVTRYAYDPAGRLSRMTDPADNAWTYAYDLRGNRTSADDPDAGTTTQTYDVLGQLLTSSDATGKKLKYAYDALGRKTSLSDGDTTGQVRAEWSYDTLRPGLPTSSVRYHDGQPAYTDQVTGYDAAGRPTGTQTTLHETPGLIPSELARTYATDHSWRADGTPATTGHHDTGVLPAERLDHAYDEIGRPTRLTGSLGSYVLHSGWSVHDQLDQLVLGNTYGHLSWQGFKYNLGSGRLMQSQIDRQARSYYDEQTNYAYDPAGNITSLDVDAWDDKTDAPKPVEVQCFDYDGLRQLTQAWTLKDGVCTAAAPSVDTLGGPAPYWASYTYDNTTSNRTAMTWRTPATPTQAAATTQAAYTYSAAQPHTVTDIAVTTDPATTGTPDPQLQASGGTYAYSPAGQTTTRPGPNGTTQTLEWDAEGKLTTITSGEPGAQTDTQTALYGPEGDRVIRVADGVTTAYLPGGLEIEHHAAADTSPDIDSGELKGRRYYNHAGNTIAVREDDNPGTVTTLFADHHGTANYAVANGDSNLTIRRQRPFGGHRGLDPDWPGERSFVGGTRDNTAGMIHIGARPYDAAIGRFITIDPIMHPDDPQQTNGYTYAKNTPITLSDPTGLDPPGAWQNYDKYLNAQPNPNNAPGQAGWAEGRSGAAGAGGTASTSHGGGSTAPSRPKCDWKCKGFNGILGISLTAAEIPGKINQAHDTAGLHLTAALIKEMQAQEDEPQCVNEGMGPGSCAWEIGTSLAPLGHAGTVRTGVRGLFASVRALVGSRGAANGVPRMGAVFGKRDAATKNMIRWAERHPEPGYYDVIGHGSPNSLSGMSASELAAKIGGSSGGQNIRLLSCRTACPSGSFGQDLANRLGVRVMAPTTDIGASGSGKSLTVFDGGEWRWFDPN